MARRKIRLMIEKLGRENTCKHESSSGIFNCDDDNDYWRKPAIESGLDYDVTTLRGFFWEDSFGRIHPEMGIVG